MEQTKYIIQSRIGNRLWNLKFHLGSSIRHVCVLSFARFPWQRHVLFRATANFDSMVFMPVVLITTIVHSLEL